MAIASSQRVSFFRLCSTKLLSNARRTNLNRARMMGSSEFDDSMVVPKEEVVRFIQDCMCKVGAPKEHAHTVAHHLMYADYRGHFSHGMNRVHMYAKDIEQKLTDAEAKPKIVKDFKAVALVDGQNALGQVVGKFSMELAIEKAKEYGIGMVSVRGSNHYGICGYYSLMAMQKGLIGFTCTNTSPLAAPTRSKKPALGTNPLSLGMKAHEDEFVLDMATTTVALGKIELANRKNVEIPKGWALDADGKVTTDAKKATEAVTLMPLGGEEENSGYKGYGLAVMVEILCGILSASEFGPNIRSWEKGEHRKADLGHCFMAIDPEAFAPGSQDRLHRLLAQLRALPPTIPDKPVMVAGDPERHAMEKVDRDGGITYHPNQLRDSENFARQIGVRPMKLVPRNS